MFFFSVIADEDEIGDINPVERGCLFKHEKQLKIPLNSHAATVPTRKHYKTNSQKLW